MIRQPFARVELFVNSQSKFHSKERVEITLGKQLK